MHVLHCAVPMFMMAVACAQTEIATWIGTNPSGALGFSVCAAGDVDGDGLPDFLVSEPNTSICYLVSGATHTVLWIAHTQFFASAIYPVGDVDGDGHPDFAFAYVSSGFGPLALYSGATGALLYTNQAALGVACGVGDLDGDGCDDYVAFSNPQWNGLELWTFSGRTGAPMTLLTTSAQGGSLCNVGDIDGDGRPEVAAVAGNVVIYRLQAGGQLLQFAASGGHAIATDMDHDGRKELLIDSIGGLRLWAPDTGALLKVYSLPNASGSFDVLADIDGDGVDDLIVTHLHDPILGGTGTAIISGTTGGILGAYNSQPSVPTPYSVAVIGDIDGDGIDDFVIGDPFVNASYGAVQIVSGRLLGCMVAEPVNCSGGPFPPQLGVTRPALGTVMAITGRDAPLGAPGLLSISFLPSGYVNLGATQCYAWIDLPNALTLTSLNTAPTWQMSWPIPNQRGLLGTHFALQAVYFGTNGPLGFDLTNGIWARVGY